MEKPPISTIIQKGNDQFLDQFSTLLASTDIGIWYMTGDRLDQENEFWSVSLLNGLGYATNDKPINLLSIAHPEDHFIIGQLYQADGISKNSIIARLRSKSGDYIRYELFPTGSQDNSSKIQAYIFKPLPSLQHLEDTLLVKSSMLEATSTIGKIGGWEINLETKELHWSDYVYEIHEMEPGSQPDISQAVHFYPGEARDTINCLVEELILSGKKFDVELPLVTAMGNERWVRSIGERIVNAEGKPIKVQGVFQDITRRKLEEQQKQLAIDKISAQNRQLQNFAYIVSHNLRSHSANLQMLVDFFQIADEEEDRQVLCDKIRGSSERLSSTIRHLTQVVKITQDINKKREHVTFENIYQDIKQVLEGEILFLEARFQTNFQVEEIDYPVCYMESIFLNLMTNGLKYRSEDRIPEIFIETKLEDGNVVLSCTDNGKGIDLKAHGDKIFGLYKTFHGNEDARGVGLYLVKNQVEAMGGNISVTSEINNGTTFTVKF